MVQRPRLSKRLDREIMIELNIPGRGQYEILHLVLDINGTIARDGLLVPGVGERLEPLRGLVDLHLLTADTFGQHAAISHILGLAATVIEPGQESAQKGRYIRHLGAATVVAIGNGANDVDMLLSAAVGIGVLGPEGLASAAQDAADVLVRDINDALDLLRYPRRLVATLRR